MANKITKNFEAVVNLKIKREDLIKAVYLKQGYPIKLEEFFNYLNKY